MTARSELDEVFCADSRRALRRVAQCGDGGLPLCVCKKRVRFFRAAVIQSLQNLREGMESVDG